MIQKFVCLLVLLLALTSNTKGQSAKLTVTYIDTNHYRYALKTYTTHEGLSSETTTGALKDRRGFMWIGTTNGLCRFDGYNFKSLINIRGDSTSITNNYIKCLVQDSKGRIWVGTMDGLNILDPLTEKFKRIYHREKAKGSLSNNKVWSVFCDSENTIWVGTDDGFNRYNEKNGSFIVYQPDDKNIFAMKGKSVNSIIEDNYHNLWLGNWSSGLNKFDKKTGRFTNYPQKQTINKKNPNDVWSLCYDKQTGNIWVGTYWSGLFCYNPSTGYYKSYLSTDPENKAAFSVLQIDRSKLIVGGDAGFYWVDIRSGRWIKITNLMNTADGSLWSDYGGIVWLCGKNGLTKIDFKQYKFNFLPFDFKQAEVKKILISDAVTWLATNKGLYKFDSSNKTTQLFVHSTNPYSITSSEISSLYTDLNGRLWITTENGFDRYDEKRNLFIHHYHYSKLRNLFNEDVFRDILEVNPHQFWLATDAGLKIFDENNNHFTHYYNDAKTSFTLNDNHLYELLKDDHNDIWIGTYGRGINRFDQKTKKFYAYAVNDKLRGSISNNLIKNIYLDSHKTLWICTADGLNKYERKSNSFTVYSTGNGFASNVFNDIIEDKHGKLWISTAMGLSKFDPITKDVKNFDEGDGVYSHTTMAKNSKGEIFVAGNPGIVYFKPDDIKLNTTPPPVFFSDFQVFNKSLVAGANSPLSEAISTAKTVKLKYDESEFSIEFVALNYTHSEKNEYAYRLFGFDKKWNYVGRQRKATYTNLSPGTYKFRVIACNNDGFWNKTGKSITIIITPPWYQTWWANLSYLFVTASIGYFYWLYQDRQAKLRYEIKIAHIESEKEKELNEKKLSFFTNISHEFRTPLTLIINPIKELLYKDDKNIDTSSLNIVYRNARRLLGLVDQLLLFRKAESEEDNLIITRLNVVSLVKEVFLCFSHQAKTKRIFFDFYSNDEYIEIYADRDKLEISLFNLISNAIKFTPEDGSVKVNISGSENDVCIDVIDSGCGIADKTGEKLFSRFYQDTNNNTSLKGGFGIGLYLVRTFINLHHGTVKYSNNTDRGTTFSIKLPNGKKHITNGHFLEDTATSSVFLKELIDDESTTNALSEAPEETAEANLTVDIKTLLVIDDNDDIRDYIKQVFKLDYQVSEAKNGEQGYILVKELLPDIVISDVMMPGMSGIELCNLIKEDISIAHIPVILLTASASPEIKLKGIEGGADDYISKPFDKELLKARVSSLLKSKNTLQQYFYNEITLNTNTHAISIEYQKFLDKCINIVGEHLKDPDFNTQLLASILGISYSTLYKRIKLISGQSANSFIRFIRLRKAAELFINTNCNIQEAAYAVGINDVKYFREQFKKIFGINPSEYVKKHRRIFTNDLINRLPGK